MVPNSGSSWRDRVGAKSAIVAIHLLSVISSIRLCVCRASRRGVECTCTPISSGCLESCTSMDCCGFLLIENVRTPFCFLHFGDSWQKLQRGDARVAGLPIFSSASSSRRCDRRRRRRGGGSVQSLISWSRDRRACESLCNWHLLLGPFATC